jgi:hypothetical protein
MAWTSKKLLAEKGILSRLNVKWGKVLLPTAEVLKQFCVSGDNSKVMPGAKVYFSVNSEGKKVHEAGCLLGWCIV